MKIDLVNLKIGNRAVKQAQKEAKIKNIPNVFSRNNKIYFELPNGEITTKIPEIYLNLLSKEELKKLKLGANYES